MSDKRILHLATDEKFINAANYLYEKAFPGENTFLIIKPASDPPLKYVKPEDNFKIYVRSPDLNDILLRAVKKYQIVVFHGLDRDMVEVFNRSENKEKFIWTFWGAEVYNSDLYKQPVFGPKTRLLEEKIRKGTILDRFREIYRKIRYYRLNSGAEPDKKAVMNKFHFIARLNEDISLFKNTGILKEDCKTIPFTYYPLEFLFNNTDLTVNGENILLGNSSSTTNNHLEMIDFLSMLNTGERKIITPLSYGNNRYASILKKYGRKKLGRSFYPLIEFLSLEEYHRLVRGCGFVIMNHYRSQGVGTILASLYLGSKIFLNDTPFYNYLKRIGCLVYSIEEDLVPQREKAFIRLTPEEMNHNRKILENEISTDSMVRRMRLSFKENFNK